MAVQLHEMNIVFAQSITGPPERRYRASRIDHHKWEPYYDEIRAKYVDENLTLDQLRQHMWRVHRFGPSRKQYTSYLNKHKIRKGDKSSYLELGSPQYSHTPFDCQSSESNFEEENPLNLPHSAIQPDEGTSDLNQDTVRPRSNRTIRRVGVHPISTLAPQSVFSFCEFTLDEHILNAISGAEDGGCQSEEDPVFIRRTADVALFFLGSQNPQQFQQLLDRLQGIINSRPADLHCHDYDVFGLLRLTRLLGYNSWSNHLKRLSCRVSLLICSFWKLDYDISARGRMFVGLIAMSLLYLNGKSISADDLPTRPEIPEYPFKGPTKTFADHVHQNCSRFINACQQVTSEADWSYMLLGLHSHHSHPPSKELQIEHVAEFVLPSHIAGLSRILRWSIPILNGYDFRLLRHNFIDLCYQNSDGQEIMAASDVVAVEKDTVYHYLVSSFWRLRGKLTSALTALSSDETAILPVFRTFLDDFGLSEFDILQGLAEIFVSQLTFQNGKTATLLYEPHYLSPEALAHLSYRFSNTKCSESREVIARWWLGCWMWNEDSSKKSDSRQMELAARLGSHVLTLISQSLEETHPSNRATARTEEQLVDIEVLPTLYNGIAGFRKVRLAGSGAERNSYNMTSSPMFPEYQDQRSSGGSSDYAVFTKTGVWVSMSPSKRSPTLPSEGFLDLRDIGSDVSKKWGFSESSKGTSSSGARSSGHKSTSGFGMSRTTSSELIEGDIQMQEFFHHERRCMSPRVMSNNSLMA